MLRLMINNLSQHFYSVNLHPYFNISNFILVSLLTKETFKKDNPSFIKSHPLANYILTIILSFAGSIIINILYGESMVLILDNSTGLLQASIVWYLIHYCPGDLVYKLCKFLPIFTIICLMKELQRCRNIFAGVDEAADRFTGSYLVWIVVGTMRGSGTNWVVGIASFIINGVNKANNELLAPSYVTKMSFLISCAYLMNKVFSNHFSVPLLFMGAVLILSYFRLLIIFTGASNPFRKVEAVISFAFFGGLADQVSLVFQQKSLDSETKKTK